MVQIQCNHITSSGYGRTSISCKIDTEKETYELNFYKKWMGMNQEQTFTICGKTIYIDYIKDPFTFHAYLCYKPTSNDPHQITYMSAIIEIISFPRLRECVVGTREHEKYCMSNSSDEFNVNGIILVEVCHDVEESSLEVDLVKNINGCSLKINEQNDDAK